jgi:hypothetical protein
MIISISCHFDEPFGRAHLCLRQSRHGSLTGRHWRGQGKLREEKSALHSTKDFSLPLEMTGYRSK